MWEATGIYHLGDSSDGLVRACEDLRKLGMIPGDTPSVACTDVVKIVHQMKYFRSFLGSYDFLFHYKILDVFLSIYDVQYKANSVRECTQ